jgi:hypothetical protein
MGELVHMSKARTTSTSFRSYKIKYKDFYAEMRKNAEYSRTLFKWEIDRMVDEMKEVGVWD